MASDRFEFRLSERERECLRELALQTDRSESGVVRLLIRSAQPTDFGGIALSSAPVEVPHEVPELAAHAA